MKKIVQIIKIKMTDSISYWVLLTEFIDFWVKMFAGWTVRWIKIIKMGKSKQKKIRYDEK